jgi:hypothetical protein
MSGSAFRTVVGCETSDFRLLKGRPKEYVKTAESGNKRIQAFCPECGTHLYAASPAGGTGPFTIRAGTISQRDRLVPRKRLWGRSEQPWVTAIEAIPMVEKS